MASTPVGPRRLLETSRHSRARLEKSMAAMALPPAALRRLQGRSSLQVVLEQAQTKRLAMRRSRRCRECYQFMKRAPKVISGVQSLPTSYDGGERGNYPPTHLLSMSPVSSVAHDIYSSRIGKGTYLLRARFSATARVSADAPSSPIALYPRQRVSRCKQA